MAKIAVSFQPNELHRTVQLVYELITEAEAAGNEQRVYALRRLLMALEPPMLLVLRRGARQQR